MEKKLATGAMVKLTKEEEEDILNGTHHFSYLSVFKSETSTSTSTRLINDTLISKWKGSSFPLKKQSPNKRNRWLIWIFSRFPILQLSKCYLRVLVDELTVRLRLSYWYEDPENLTGLIIYRKEKKVFLDFSEHKDHNLFEGDT